MGAMRVLIYTLVFLIGVGVSTHLLDIPPLYHCKPPDTLWGASLVCLASLGKVKVQANHPALCGPYQHGCIPESTTTPA